MTRKLWQSRLLRFLRTVLSLLCGIVTGVALVTTIEIGPDVVATLQHKKHIIEKCKCAALFPPMSISFTARMGVAIGTCYAIIIVLLCLLPWWLLGRFDRRNFATAALLGFLMTWAVWALPAWWDHSFVPDDSLQFALAGAVAGLVTFWVSRPLRVSAV